MATYMQVYKYTQVNTSIHIYHSLSNCCILMTFQLCGYKLKAVVSKFQHIAKVILLSQIANMQTSRILLILFTQIKQVIQSSKRNSILGIYGWIQLCKLPLINFGLIQFSSIPGMKSLSCPSQFLF